MGVRIYVIATCCVGGTPPVKIETTGSSDNILESSMVEKKIEPKINLAKSRKSEHISINHVLV